MNWNLKRKFWKEVEVEHRTDGYRLLLDGRELQTPAKTDLPIPTAALAEAMAAEWAAQDAQIVPDTMPLTRAANSAVVKVAPQFDAVAGMLAEYGGTDLICYRAHSPAELIARQTAAWDPWLDWSATELKAPLLAVMGVIHHQQPQSSLANLRNAVASYSPFELAGLHDLVTLSGSLVLALAVARQAIEVDAAWELSRIDENWQIEQWGEDELATEAAERKRSDFRQAAKLLELLRQA